MINESMADLVGVVRAMIGDPNAEQFTDDEIEDVLDTFCRIDVWYAQCKAEPSIESGTLVYKSFYAPGRWWATDAQLVDGTYVELTGTAAPSVADCQRGYFEFDYEPTRPVFIRGAKFSVELAAAILLERWAAAIKEQVSFRDPNYQFAMNERWRNMREMAAYYRSQAPPTLIKAIRMDCET